jgi:hypothetical protein
MIERREMRIFSLVFATVLVAGVGCKGGDKGEQAKGDSGGANESLQAPAIFCDEPIYDFGEVQEGEQVNHVFVIKNIGNDVLKIASARGSCGCTATMVSKNEIPPGGEGQVQVRLSTLGRVGLLEKTVTVASNDPKQPSLILKMKGKVERYLSFDPEFLNLQKVLKGKKVTATARLSGKLAQDARLSNLVPSDPKAISAKLLDEKTIEVVFDASQVEGQFSGTVVAETNLEKPKNVTLRITARVVQDLFVEPERVYLPEEAVDEKLGAQVKVLSLTGKPFSIKRAYDPQGFVRVNVQKDGGNYILDLSLKKAPSEGHGVVVVETDSKDQKKLEVFYIATKQGAPPIRRLLPPLRK